MKLNKIILILTVTLLTAIMAGGSLFYFANRSNAVNAAHAKGESSVKKISEQLDLIIGDHHSILQSVAGLQEVKKAVSTTEKELLNLANKALKHFQMTLDADVIYLMDRNGYVKVTSNFDSSDSFVGMNFGFRPYFKEALNGHFGAYPALGVAARKRGLYLSCPVFPNENGIPGGVLVMQDFPDHLQDELDFDDSDLFLLTSPEGIVFMSSFGKMDFNSLWSISKEVSDKIIAGRQFGDGPWKWSGFSFDKRRPKMPVVEDSLGVRYMVHKYGLKSLQDWELYYLHDLENIYKEIEKPLFRSIGLPIIVISLFLSLLAGFLYRLASKEIKMRQKVEDDLKSNEEQVSSFFQTAGAIILVISPEHRILEINPSAESFYGVQREQVIGVDYIENFLPENERKPVVEVITEVLQGKRVENLENQMLAANGEERVVLWNANRLGDEIRGVKGVIIIGQDINERIHAEYEMNNLFNMVERAKKEWEGSLDCIDDKIVIVSSEGIIKRMNLPFRKFFSASYMDLIGKDWKTIFTNFSLLDDDDKELEIAEPRRVWHENTRSWLIVTRFELDSDTPGGSFGSVIIIRDETKLHQTLEELDKRNFEIDQNRTKLQHALDELSSIIQRVADEEDFGVRFENSNIQKCWEVMQCGEKDCPCYEKYPLRCWQVAGTYCSSEIQGKFAKKRESCVTCKVFEASTQDPIFMIGEEFNNMMYILEQKNVELQNAYEELKQIQFQILQQEKMASMGQLAAGVAHEINNPMGFIGSNLASLGKYSSKLTEFIALQGGMLEKINDPDAVEALKAARKRLKLDFIVEDMQDLISESLEGADRVKQIVMGLKNFSRIDQAEQHMANMNDCVETSLSVVWNEIKYKASVEKEYGDIPRIMCFPQQLNQVFVNLLVNGVQAIDKQGVITLKTEEADGYVLVSVSDTGCGISPEDQKKIFEPFFTTKDIGKGTGLGMSIAYDIIKKHGGEIVIDSEIGKGSTFTVRLPVNSGSEIAEEA